MRKHCIYFMIDEDKNPFYVGQTLNIEEGIRSHNRNAKNKNTLPKYNKLRKVLKIVKDINECFIIIENNIKESNIDNKEIYYIKKLKEDGYKLYNLTEGGYGGRRSPEINKKIGDKNRGKKRTEESKKKISDSRKGIKFSKKHKSNLSKAWKKRKKRPVSKETRDKRSISTKGKIHIKKFELTDPSNNKYITQNGLTLFCEQHNLSASLFYKVMRGERLHHKGWACKRIDIIEELKV